MSKGKSLTTETMRKVWSLHEKKVDKTTIAYTLGISTASVTRVIRIMEAAKNGLDLTAHDDGNRKVLCQFAREYFGIKEKQSEPETPKKTDEHNTAVFMIKVLSELQKTNALLERLCADLGI